LTLVLLTCAQVEKSPMPSKVIKSYISLWFCALQYTKLLHTIWINNWIKFMFALWGGQLLLFSFENIRHPSFHVACHITNIFKYIEIYLYKFHLNGCVSYYSDHKHNVISQHSYLNFELLILKQKFALTIKKSIAIQT
jgi:hypothetical protein